MSSQIEASRETDVRIADPWHWPPSQRRMFVEIIEASERLAAKRAADAP